MAKKASGPWVLAAPAWAWAPLAPLIAARKARQKVVVLSAAPEAVLADPAAHLPPNAAALVVVGARRRGPRQSLPGLWVTDRTGRQVPLGWLPGVAFGLATYAHAAARLLQRRDGLGALAVLGQWEDRFLRVALRTSRWFEKHPAATRTFHWTADRIARPDLMTGLQAGLGAAVYYGHGRGSGWAGYRGVRATDFPVPWPEPLGGLFAVCCQNAVRRGSFFSFAEMLVMQGVCGGVLAATEKTLHEENRRIGPALCEVLTNHSRLTLADAVTRMDLPADFWDRSPYRFIGDPLAPLAAAAGAADKAAEIYAPAPDEPLRAWS